MQSRNRKTRRTFWRRIGVAGVVVAAMSATLIPSSGVVAAESQITEYGPLPSSLPVGGVCESHFDRKGKLWVEQYLGSQIARFDPSTGQFTEFDTPMPLSVPGGMAIGQDDHLWAPQVTGNSLLRIDTNDGSMQEIPLPWANALSVNVLGHPLHTGLGLANDIARGPDDAMWFTLPGLSSVGRIDMRTHEMTKYPIPGDILGAAEAAFGIIKPGPGRSIVADLPQVNKVVTINVDTKEFTSYTMPTPASFPVGVFTAADGSIWATESLGMKVARIDPATGHIREFPLLGVDELLGSLLGGLSQGTVGNPVPLPGPIAQGSDGNMYFTVSFPASPLGLGNQIAQLNPTTGRVRMWPTPSSFSSPCDLNTEQAGSVWFSEFLPNKIARLTFG